VTWRTFIQLLVTMLGLSGVKARQLPPVASGVSRRAFLKALGVSAVALANLPAGFALDEPLVLDEAIDGGGFDLAQFDSILKELYAPAILAQLNAESSILKFMDAEPPAMPPWLTVPVHYGRNSS
jgi:hypothetical protein